ncbi:hypothetical protein HYW60_02995 [Candidatus Kaiserbacteria bacterium]|nr:hypothetical protein [Candidatus Kaiserbacteria bacterium]
MSSVEIIPTIVPASLTDIEGKSDRYSTFASFFQIDVADGKFAPNTTWLPSRGDSLPQAYGYEVHLMVSDPGLLGVLFAEAGARSIIGHLEALSGVDNAKQIFEDWRASGARSIGLAVLLQTPLEDVIPYLSNVDFVLLMTIARIGVQGIPFDESAPARVAEFRRRFPNVLIAVDGGVSASNIEELARAGASRFGVGSAISRASNPAEAYVRLKHLAESASLMRA